MSTTYPWKRYWVARDSGYSSDGGYLADPESEYAWADASRATSLAELRDRPALVLLGEAGMGKSRALLQEYNVLRESPPENTYLIYRNLNAFGAGEQRRLAEELFQGMDYVAYRSGARLTFFLDSLDEALSDMPRLDNWLAEQLRRHVIYPDRFQLRIASRTANWSESLETAISQLLPSGNDNKGVAVYEICPLRRVDVVEAANTKAFDADAFLDEVKNKEIEALASRPVTLEFLFSQWDRYHALSSSKAKLYEDGILALCEENNPERRSRPLLSDTQQRMAVAGRIASSLMLCGHSALWLGRIHDLPPGDISVSSLPGKEKLRDGDFQVDESLLRETMNTAGLFTGYGRDRMGFAHQSFAEFLAAWYLHRTGNEVDQTLRPLRHQEGGKVLPKLQETAAWLASLNRPVLERLIDEEPSLLLHVDGAVLTDADKARMVQALLDRIAAKTLFPHDLPRRPLRKLSHPGLAEQLRPWITGREHNMFARDFAMDLARWCEVQSLAADLVRIALDPAEEYQLRISATHAVTWIKDDAALAALKPLALEHASPDPDRRLKNLALHALWPRHLTAEEFFRDPIDVNERNILSSLDHDIYTGAFFDTLGPAHIPAALDWVRRNAEHHLNFGPGRLLRGLMRTAWQWLEDVSVLDEFAATTLCLLKQHVHLFDDSGRASQDDPLAETKKRWLLLSKLLGMVTPEQANSLVYFGDSIARSEDLPWLLDMLDTGLSETQHRNIASLIDALLRFDSPSAMVSRVLDRCGVEAAKPDLILRKALAWMVHPMRFKSRHVQQVMASRQETRDFDTKRKPVLLDPPPKERVRLALERAEQGEWKAWPDLALELTMEPTSYRYTRWPHNLQEQPGWLEAIPEIQT